MLEKLIEMALLILKHNQFSQPSLIVSTQQIVATLFILIKTDISFGKISCLILAYITKV